MPAFTVEIQASEASDASRRIWQAMEPAYNCDPAAAGWGAGWTAQDVAGVAADHQNAAVKPFRVAVWEGHDADTGTAPVYVLDVEDDAPAPAPEMTAQQLAERLIGEFASRHRHNRCAGEGWGDAAIWAVETAYGWDYQTATEYVGEQAQDALADQC